MTMDVASGTQVTGRRLGELLALARELAEQPDLGRALDLVQSRSRQALDCDAVSIALVKDGSSSVAAATEPAAERAEVLQLDCGEGPGVDAVAGNRNVAADHVRVDSRWPVWGPLAAELQWRSVLSVALVGQERAFGALTLYSRRASFFVAADLPLADLLAAQASVALAGARERESLLKAVDARHLIGQAQGILMERYRIDAEQAFTVLRRYSSHLNRKLRLVAEDIVQDRQLPTL